MNRLIIATLIGLFLSTAAMAQGQTTIIRQQGSDVQVTQQPNEPSNAFMSFQEADLNGDGRIDREEARNAGIMGFGAAGGGKGYLTPEEYAAAGGSADVGAAR